MTDIEKKIFESQESLEYYREKARTDFEWFLYWILWGGERILEDVHKKELIPLAEHVVGDFPREVRKGNRRSLATPNITRSLFMIPRGTFKSTILTEGMAIWFIIRNPNVRIALGSWKQEIANGFLRGIKAHLEENDLLRRMFKYIFWDNPRSEAPKWTESEVLCIREGKYKEATIETFGIEKQPTSRHYDVMILDDTVNITNVGSEKVMQKVEDNVRLLSSLLMPGYPMIFVGTRYHFADVYGKMEQDTGIGEEFFVFRRSCYDEDGETPLFPRILNKEELARIRKQQGEYIFSCNPGYAPVWMSDMTFKRLDEVEIGDEVVGFEHSAEVGKRRKMLKSKVIAKNSRNAHVVKITLESGRKIVCTPDHQWFTRRTGRDGHSMYLPARIGGSLWKAIDPVVTPPPPGTEAAYAYLAGMIDGEGACKYGNISISQSKDHNPAVHARIGDVVAQLGFDCNQWDDERKPNHATMFVLNGGKQMKVNLINWADPAKKQQIVDNIWSRPGFHTSQDKITKIEYAGTEKVYALTTETGNYVVWGYASKNCQYRLEPVNPENIQFNVKEIKTYKTLPKDLRYYIGFDPTSGTAKRGDPAAIMVMGMHPDTGDIYLADGFRAKVQITEQMERFISFGMQYRPSASKVEAIGQFAAAVEKPLMERKMARNAAFPHEIVKGYSRSLTGGGTGEKPRLTAVLCPVIDAGRLHFPASLYVRNEDGKQIDLVKLILEEMRSYPFGRHDDLIDAMVLAIMAMPPAAPKERRQFDSRRMYGRTHHQDVGGRRSVYVASGA